MRACHWFPLWATEYAAHSHSVFKIHFNIILLWTLSCMLSNQNVSCIPLSPMRATCTVHLIIYIITPQSTDHELIPQGMRVLRQCKVPRAEVMFVTINVKTLAPQRKTWRRRLQCLNCPMFAVRLWITTSPYRWPVGSLPSTCMLCTPPALN
jgi:hypothetical protein